MSTAATRQAHRERAVSHARKLMSLTGPELLAHIDQTDERKLMRDLAPLDSDKRRALLAKVEAERTKPSAPTRRAPTAHERRLAEELLAIGGDFDANAARLAGIAFGLDDTRELLLAQQQVTLHSLFCEAARRAAIPEQPGFAFRENAKLAARLAAAFANVSDSLTRLQRPIEQRITVEYQHVETGAAGVVSGPLRRRQQGGGYSDGR